MYVLTYLFMQPTADCDNHDGKRTKRIPNRIENKVNTYYAYMLYAAAVKVANVPLISGR